MTMTYDEMPDHIKAELDRATARELTEAEQRELASLLHGGNR